jgi:hypothetical protein
MQNNKPSELRQRKQVFIAKKEVVIARKKREFR